MKIYKKPLMKPHKLRMEAMMVNSTDSKAARGARMENWETINNITMED
ncbi:MAG: hypothetical protein Q4E68_08170 [Prevotellaceae bacterium]|nr:hypothetical protein [Prevotellaceae bacterium]